MNAELNEWIATMLMGDEGELRGYAMNAAETSIALADDPEGQLTRAAVKSWCESHPLYHYVERRRFKDYSGTYDGMGAVIEALHARKDTTYLIDMSAEYGNGGKLVWRVNVCTPRNSYCWRDAYGPLWEHLPLGVAESVKRAIELEQEKA